MTDQIIGGGIVGGNPPRSAELGQDLLRELLAELDSPLVKGVDAPDDALHEDLVLIHRDQLAERAGGELLEQDAVGGPVALEVLVRDEPLNPLPGDPLRRELGADFFLALSAHQSFGLRKEVREKDLVVRPDRVLASGRS